MTGAFTRASLNPYHGAMRDTDAAELAARRHLVAREVRAAGASAAVFGTGAHFTALTGTHASSHERLTALVIPAEQPSGASPAVLIAPVTDVAAFLDAPGLAGPDSAGGLDSAANVKVWGWRDGEDPYALVARAVCDAGAAGAAGSTATTEHGVVELGASLTADHVFALLDQLPGARPLSPGVLAVFETKSPAEIAALTAAAAAIDKVHAKVPELLRPGRTEENVARELARLIEHDHERVDFVIVGSGPNGANPHHEFSHRVLREGDPVVVDIGGTAASGYRSDCTRTYVVSGPDACRDESFLRAYAVLQQAQTDAVAAARPGITAGELDAAAREPIEHAGFGEWFTHRLGHGIGLDTHEAPYIVGGSEVVLRESMAFSIEPGIYKPGAWGMRIEDIVCLGAAGACRLNAQPRELR